MPGKTSRLDDVVCVSPPAVARSPSPSTSLWAPKKSLSSNVVIWSPKCVADPCLFSACQLFSAIPRRLMLCLLTSIATIDAFPFSYIVLTFRTAITVRCFGERKIDHVGIRCCWLCRLHALSRRPPPTRQLVYVWCFICVSLTVVLFLGGVVSPTLNPQ